MSGSEIFVVIGLALTGTFASMFLKDSRVPIFAVLVSLVIGVIIFLRFLPQIGALFDFFNEVSTKIDVEEVYLGTLFKVIAISYIGEFGAQICRDAGQNAIAFKVEFAAKILIILMSIPILAMILNSILGLL